MSQQPTLGIARTHLTARRFTLTAQPALVGIRRHPGPGGDAPMTQTHIGSQQSFGGEQGHLGVIGNRPAAAVHLAVFGNPVGTKASVDFLFAQKLDRRA